MFSVDITSILGASKKLFKKIKKKERIKQQIEKEVKKTVDDKESNENKNLYGMWREFV